MKYTVITEGKTKLMVPYTSMNLRGPGRRNSVFYNPSTAISRDITVLVMNTIKKEQILDGFGGVGARGIRIAKEYGGNVVINEKKKSAYEVIKKNIQLNSLENVTIKKYDFNVLLSIDNPYEYVDIDPYGSPVEFIDTAFRSVKKECIFGITATDTATLCGVYPTACKRRYFAESIHCEHMKEFGVRILLQYLVREAVKYNLYVIPLIIQSTSHYFRVYIKTKRDAKRATKCLKYIEYISYSTDKMSWRVGCIKNDEYNTSAGPIWTGMLYDKELINRMLIHIDNYPDTVKKLVYLWKEEMNAPLLYYTTTSISRKLKCSPPRIKDLINHLRENGFIATKTHFSSVGFKTNASYSDIIRYFC